MYKLNDESTYSVESLQDNKCLLELSHQFVVMGIHNKKNSFDFAYPRFKHCCNMFCSYDNSKILFLNNTNIGYLYNVNDRSKSKQVNFGDNIRRHCFVAYKNGYFYLNGSYEIEWFDIITQEITKLPFLDKYSFLYDDAENAYFMCIDEFGQDIDDCLLSVKCFSKKDGEFLNKSLSLPRGCINDFRKISQNIYYIVLQQIQDDDSPIKLPTKIYLFDSSKFELIYLFDEMDYTEDEDDFFVAFQADLEKKIGYILYNHSLRIIDLEEKSLLSCFPTEDVAFDLKLVSNYLIIATGSGAYRYEIDTRDGSIS